MQKKIGMENESSLHHALKTRFAGAGGSTEVERGAFVCDACTRDGSIIEVQTGSFAPLQKKAAAPAGSLPRGAYFVIIHPIVVKKYLELYDASGALIRRSASPRKGTAYDVFRALLYAPKLAVTKKVRILLPFVEVREIRSDDGKGSWRRGGVSIRSRELLSCGETIVLGGAPSLRRFVPFPRNSTFTVRDLEREAHIRRSLAAKTVWTLKTLGIIAQIGVEKRFFVYMLT